MTVAICPHDGTLNLSVVYPTSDVPNLSDNIKKLSCRKTHIL